MFRPARLPFSPISPLSRRLFIFIRKWHRRNSYLRHGAGSLHRRLYSGRIILVTKSIVTAAIKIHTDPSEWSSRRQWGCPRRQGYTFGVEKIVCRSSQDKGWYWIAHLFYRELPTSSVSKNKWKKKKKTSYSQNGRGSSFAEENGILNKPRIALLLCLLAFK